jgi:hypothetical protein
MSCFREMSCFRSSITKTTDPKPTVSKPQSTRDCRILLERTNDDCERTSCELYANNKQIDELTLKIQELQKQLVLINETNTSQNTEYIQHQTNQSYLKKCLYEFSQQDLQDSYFIRCMEYINKYKWVDPEHKWGDPEYKWIDSEFKWVDGKLELPDDVFSFLNLTFAPIDSYTSNEIIRIAHYLKASELVRLNKYTCENCYCTYREAYSDGDVDFHCIFFGDLVDSNGDEVGSIYDDSIELYRKAIIHLEDVNLDTTIDEIATLMRSGPI